MIFYPFSIKTNVAFFYVWFFVFVLTMVIGRGPNIVLFFNGRQNKTFKLFSKFFHNGRLINLCVDFFCKTSSFPVIFLTLQKLRKDEKVINLKKYKFASMLTKFASRSCKLRVVFTNGKIPKLCHTEED